MMEKNAMDGRVAALEEQVRRLNEKRFTDNEQLSRYISTFVLISTICATLVAVLLIVACAVPGMLTIENREFIVSILLILLAALLTIMWLARRNAKILLPLLAMMLCIYSLGLGYVVCAFQSVQ